MKAGGLLAYGWGHPRLAAASLAALVAAGSLAFSVLPRSAAARRLEARIRRTADRGSDGVEASASATGARAIEEGWRQLRRRLPAEADINGLTADLSTLSQMAAVSISDIQREPPERVGGFVRTPLVLSFRGRARAVCEFLEAMKALDRLIGIEALQVQVLADGSLQVRSTIEAYSGGE